MWRLRLPAIGIALAVVAAALLEVVAHRALLAAEERRETVTIPALGRIRTIEQHLGAGELDAAAGVVAAHRAYDDSDPRLAELAGYVEQGEAHDARYLAGELGVHLRALAMAETTGLRRQLDLIGRVALAQSVLVLALVIALALVIERSVAQRTARLAATVRRLAAGDLEAPVDVDGTDEIGRIAADLEVFRAASADVEMFVSAAAHDMRSPLYAIEQLVGFVIEDHGDALAADAREDVDEILHRTRRLQRLLADLLDYARARAEPPEPWGALDMGAIVVEARDLADPAGRHDVRMSGPAEGIRGPAVAVERIVSNLVTNAIRHHDGERATVHVAARETGPVLHLVVTDDGPGIAPEHHERALAPFRQITRTAHGSGLGLALVRRLAERHGGAVRIESDPAVTRGTSVYVSLRPTVRDE